MEHYEMNGASLRAHRALLHGNAGEERQYFQGLPEEVTHIDVLNLLKSVYRELGLGDSEMMHLEYMLIRTQPQDWQEGQRPVFYQSVQRIAEERGLTSKQVNRLEHRLEAVGLITWSDRGNYKRGGLRGESGRIIYAYGVDLSPLAIRYHELGRLAREKQEYMNHMNRLRVKSGILSRRIHVLRKELANIPDLEVQCVADHIVASYKNETKRRSDRLSEQELYERIKMQQDYIAQLEILCKKHIPAPENSSIVTTVITEENSHIICELTVNMTDTSVKNVRHIYNNTNSHSSKEEILCNHAVDNVNKTECALAHNSAPLKIAFGNAGHLPLQEKKSNKGIVRHHINHHSQQINHPPALSFIKKSNYPNGSSGRSVGDIGLDHLTPTMAMQAMSPAFEHHLPVGYDGFGWHEIIQAAEKMLPFLGISEHAWREACGSLGRTGAALCILIADARAEEISSYGGFLRACVRKAEDGKLHLHKSIFGLMKKCGQRMM
jgi:replication initiation protein RepC